MFIMVERKAEDPVMPFAIWKNPVIFYANLVSLTTGVILIGISSYLPTFVTGVMEQPAIIAGFTLTAMSIGWPIASSVAGHLLIRFGTFQVSFAGGISLVTWYTHVCMDDRGIRSLVGCNGKLFCRRWHGLDEHFVHRHNPRCGQSRTTGFCDGC